MRRGRHGSGDHHRAHRGGLTIPGDVGPKRDLAVKLGVIARLMRKSFDQNTGQLGVTRSQWGVIVVTSRHPGATQRTIAEILEMTEASAGRLIDRLCADGLLERRAKPDDRRAYCVYLTGKAMPLLSRLEEFGRTNEAMAFAGLADGELDQLAALLDRVYANLAGAKP